MTCAYSFSIRRTPLDKALSAKDRLEQEKRDQQSREAVQERAETARALEKKKREAAAREKRAHLWEEKKRRGDADAERSIFVPEWATSVVSLGTAFALV
jgi:hypothetical protein